MLKQLRSKHAKWLLSKKNFLLECTLIGWILFLMVTLVVFKKHDIQDTALWVLAIFACLFLALLWSVLVWHLYVKQQLHRVEQRLLQEGPD